MNPKRTIALFVFDEDRFNCLAKSFFFLGARARISLMVQPGIIPTACDVQLEGHPVDREVSVL
jgi:hypothetical protein